MQELKCVQTHCIDCIQSMKNQKSLREPNIIYQNKVAVQVMLILSLVTDFARISVCCPPMNHANFFGSLIIFIT